MADRFVSGPTTAITTGNRVVLPLKFQISYGDPLTAQDPSRLEKVVFKRDDGRGGQYEHVMRGPYDAITSSYRPAWTAEVDISRFDGGGWATFAIRPGDEIEVNAEDNPGIDAEFETKGTQRYTITEVNQDRLSFSGWSLEADSYPAVVSIRRKRHPLRPDTPGVLLYESVQVIAGTPGNRKVVRSDEGVLDAYWQTDDRTPPGRYSAIGYWVDGEQNERTTRQVEFTLVAPSTPSGSVSGPITSNWEDVYLRWLPSLYDNIAQDENVKKMTRVIGKVTNAMTTAIQSLVDAPDPLRAGPRELTHMANNIGWKLLGNNPESWRKQLFNAVEINGLKGTKESIERSLSFIDATVVGWSSYWQVLPKYTWTDYAVIKEMDAQGRPVIALSHRPVFQVAHGRETELDRTNRTLAGRQLPAPRTDAPGVISDFWKIERRKPAATVFRLSPGVSAAGLRWEDTNDLIYANPSSNVIVYRQRPIPAEADGNVYGELRSSTGRFWIDRYYVRVIDGDHSGYYPIINIDGKKLGDDDYILVGEVPDELKGQLLRAEIVVRTRSITEGNNLVGKFVTLSNSRSDEALFGDADDDTYASRPEMFSPPAWQTVFDGHADAETNDIDSVIIVKGTELVWLGQQPTFEDVEYKEDAYLTSLGNMSNRDWRAVIMAAGFDARPKNTGISVGDELRVTYLRRKMPLVHYADVDGEIVSTSASDPDGFGLIRKNEYEAESILSVLPVADKRDPASRELYFARSKPPVDFNTRLMEDGNEDLPLVCATLNPAAEPVIFGHVRTDARWSTKIYNEETYDGSMRPSHSPCDIEPDFREECDCAWSSFFSVQVEIGMLSDEKTRLCQEVINRFSPVQAVLHEMSVIGKIEDSTMIRYDKPTIDIDMDIEDIVFDSPVYFDRSGLHGRRRGDLVQEITVTTGSGVAKTPIWEVFDTTIPDLRDRHHGVKVRLTDENVTADLSGAERWSIDFSSAGLGYSDGGEVSYELYRDRKAGTGTVMVLSRYYIKPGGPATIMGYAGSESIYSRLNGPGADLSGLPLNLGSDGSYRIRVLENGIAVDTYNVLGYDHNGIEVDRALPGHSVVFQLIYRDANGDDAVLSDGRGEVTASFVGSLSGVLDGLINFTPETRDEAGRSIMALFIETNSIRIGERWHRIIRATPDAISIEWDTSTGYSGPFYLSELIHSSVDGQLSWRSNKIELDFDIEAQAAASISANDPGLPPATIDKDLHEFLVVYDGRYYAISGRPVSGVTTIIGWIDSPSATASLVHVLPKEGQRFNMGGKKVQWTSASVDTQSGEWSATRRIWPTEAGQISESIQITIEDDGQQNRVFVLE